MDPLLKDFLTEKFKNVSLEIAASTAAQNIAVGQITSQVQGLNTRVGALETKVGDLDTKVDNIRLEEAEVKGHKSNERTVKDRVHNYAAIMWAAVIGAAATLGVVFIPHK